MTNRTTLDSLRHMPVSDIIALPAEHLALLQTEAREALDAAKRMQDWIEAAIALRFEQRAVGARAAAGKDTGIRCEGWGQHAGRRHGLRLSRCNHWERVQTMRGHRDLTANHAGHGLQLSV